MLSDMVVDAVKAVVTTTNREAPVVLIAGLVPLAAVVEATNAIAACAGWACIPKQNSPKAMAATKIKIGLFMLLD